MYTKPQFLYHGSASKNVEVFEPRAESIRHPDEGPVVFATENEAEASKFLLPSANNWCILGAFTHEVDSKRVRVSHALYADKAKFMELDKGGAIYKLSSETFSLDPTFSKTSKEWTSKVSVVPLAKTVYTSALEAMLEFSIQVYFITAEILESIRVSDDNGYSIIKSLESENMKRNLNVVPLP